MSAIPIGLAVGGPIAAAILSVDWLGLAGWRWLFLLEGLPAILLGVVTLFWLPDRPAEVRWLRNDEREWLAARLAEERDAKTHVEHITVWQALRHPAVLILTVGLFFTYCAGYALWLFLPTILERFTGWTVQRIGWVQTIPFTVGLIGMLLLGWNSDRTGERRWHFAVPQLTSAVALSAWFFFPSSNVILIALLSLAVFGSIAYLPSFWALPSSFLSSSAAAAAIGFINCMASIGGFFGPKIFGDLSQRTGSFHTGFIFMVACWIIASILVLVCPRERPSQTS